MKIKVVNRYRWRRTKIYLAVGCWVGGLACVGGLEGDPYAPMPSWQGAIVFLISAFFLAVNLLREDSRP